MGLLKTEDSKIMDHKKLRTIKLKEIEIKAVLIEIRVTDYPRIFI